MCLSVLVNACFLIICAYRQQGRRVVRVYLGGTIDHGSISFQQSSIKRKQFLISCVRTLPLEDHGSISYQQISSPDNLLLKQPSHNSNIKIKKIVVLLLTLVGNKDA